MKKLMNKKVNVFGKAVPVFAFVILGLALVSAALVPYLSGLVIGTVDVESPITLEIRETEGETWGASVSLGPIYGSETVTFYIREETYIDDLVSDLLIRVEETEYGVNSCDEFDEVTFTNIEYPDVPYDITELCTLVDESGGDVDDFDENAKYLQFVFESEMPTAGERVYEVKATFALNALGDYEATIQHFMEYPLSP